MLSISHSFVIWVRTPRFFLLAIVSLCLIAFRVSSRVPQIGNRQTTKRRRLDLRASGPCCSLGCWVCRSPFDEGKVTSRCNPVVASDQYGAVALTGTIDTFEQVIVEKPY